VTERGDSRPEVDPETVLGIDNVPLALPIAGVGSRVLAAFLDALIQAVLQLVWLVVFILLLRGASARGVWPLVAYLGGAFLIDWSYFAGTEIAFRGRTPGKKAVGLRVVGRAGGTASAGALLTRNLLRPVDLVVGIPLLAIDPLSRRLGDRVADTVVVHDRPSEEPLVLRIPQGWQSGDVALVESLLRRARDLEPARAEAMARRILSRIEREQPAFLNGAPRHDALATLRSAFGVEASR
jgi:uncharacterized RDD family membrane protein YckC